MDFWGALRVLRRRWYIAVPSAVVAVAIAAAVFLSIPTRYQSSGVMVLTTPAAGGTFSEKVSPQDAVRINPLLAFDGSLATTSQILAQILTDPKTRESLGVTASSKENFTATGGGQNGPFLFVTGDGDTPETAEAMVSTVLGFASTQLEEQQRQLNAPTSTFITSQVIVTPTKAEAQIGGKVRYAGAALVVMMLLTTAATFGAESVLNHRQRRRDAASAAGGNPTEGDDGERDLDRDPDRDPEADGAEEPGGAGARHGGARHGGGRSEGRRERDDQAQQGLSTRGGRLPKRAERERAQGYDDAAWPQDEPEHGHEDPEDRGPQRPGGIPGPQLAPRPGRAPSDDLAVKVQPTTASERTLRISATHNPVHQGWPGPEENR